MTDSPNYFDLAGEGSWIDYIRARLPYSFGRIEEKSSHNRRYYVLSEPTVEEGSFSAKRHNFWKRGVVFYMTGKLIDLHSLSSLWKTHRDLKTNRLWNETLGGSLELPTIFSQDSYNAMQSEKVWRYIDSNVLDRERVLMTNVFQAVELCLKAVMAHARFRERNEFTFDYGHDITKLYEALPDELQEEIALESATFTRDYRAFRDQVEADIKILHNRWFQNPVRQYGDKPVSTEDWILMAKRIDRSNYTSFTNVNDPIPYEGWFEDESLHSVCTIDQMASPNRDEPQASLTMQTQRPQRSSWFYKIVRGTMYWILNSEATHP